MIVYCLENKINNKKYVGITTGSLENRLSQHLYESVGNRKKIIHKAIYKYGIDNFNVSVLYNCDSLDELKLSEIHYISELNTLIPNGYNMTLGGDGIWGYKHDELTKSRISDSSKNVWKLLKNDVDRLSNRNLSISNKLQGRIFTVEHKAKLSLCAKERVGNKNPFYGREHTDETKSLISQANKGRVHNSRRKPVKMILENGDSIVFDSCMKAYDYLLLNGYTNNKSYRSVTSMIKESINNGYKLYGCKWCYIEKV